jgi:hypothetical protein
LDIPWLNLKYVDDNGMACTACTEFGEQNGMFVTAVLAVDDRHVTFCDYNGSVARIICVAVATLANENLRNHWANCNQTLVEWSLDGLLPNMCAVILTSNQDGRQAKNRKKGG